MELAAGLERAAASLWVRGREHFEGYYLAIGVSAGVVVISLPTAIVASSYLRLARHDAFVFAAVVCIVTAIGTPAAAAIVGHRYFAAVRSWAKGDHSDPAAAHETFVRMSRAVAFRTSTVLAPIHLLTTCVVGAHLAHLSAPGALALVLAVLAVLWAGAALGAAALELLLLPVRREAAAALNGAHRDIARGGLSARLMMLTGAVSWFSAMVPGAIVARTTEPEARWVVAVGVGTLVAAVLTIAYFGALGLPSVVRPIRELIAGTRAVTAGDLTVRVPVTSDDEIAELTASFNDMVRGLADRERLHAAFGTYVDPALARRLLDDAQDVFAGEELDVTVLFADIRGFTAYAERADAREVVARLNRLFGLVVPVLREHGGHANKYLGDGVLAVFGAPEPVADHATSAIVAAGEIQRVVRANFGESLRIGIGINTGRVIVGTIGGGGKLEFTLIGDTVNVAARVEQLTKETNDAILMTEATCDALSAAFPVVDRGEYTVRGKSAPVHVFALVL